MTKRKTAKISWAHDPLSFGRSSGTQRQTKLKLAYAINRAIKNQKLRRAATVGTLNLAPQKIASLRSYSLKGFSVEELAKLLMVVNRMEDAGRHRLH